jgi:hypothetical protein
VEAKSLGQIAYDAYGEHQAWVVYDGKQMPSWPSVRKDIQDAWQAAAKAVAVQVTRARQQTELEVVEAQDTAHG